MQAVEALDRLGGIARAQELLRLTTRRKLRRAVRAGSIRAITRGRYALPTADVAAQAAAALSGVVCLRSAAAHHGWALKEQPEVPEVAVPRGRNLSAERRVGVRVVWMNLAADDRAHGVTTPLRTVVDCARRLPFDEALAVVDSALRSGLVQREQLERVDVRGAGAEGVRRTLQHADGRAANPFESALRALAIGAGLTVEPQRPLDLGSGIVHPDLTDVARRLVLEADSWTHHATRSAHRRDCARYNLLVLRGWLVLRFTWEQVMLDQAYVRWVLDQVRRVERPEVARRLALPA
jgi:very-short-patch-repair endonuclease